jgi:hypothetical protein
VVNEARPNAAAADWDEVLGGYFTVRQSKQRPEAAAVAVRYRGYWFYIADDDLDSKSTFDLIGHLFALQASAGDGASPLLTLGSG